MDTKNKSPQNTESEQGNAIVDDTINVQYNDDIEIEEEDAHPGDTIKKLRTQLKQCISEKQEYLDGWQRLRADFANYKKRDEEDRAHLQRKSTEKVLLDIIPALDSFEMAMGNKEVWEKIDSGWRSGIEYIRAQLSSGLGRHGLIEIPTKEGEPYNVQIETALSLIDTDNEQLHHTISRVVQRGYQLGEKILRSPQVEVYEFKPTAKND